MARRFRTRLTVTAAGCAVAVGLGVPAAAQASTAQVTVTGASDTRTGASGYTPSSAEWWMSEWAVPQDVWPFTEGAGVTVGVIDSGVQASLPDLRGAVLRGTDVLNEPGNGDIDYSTNPRGHGTTVAALIAGQGVGPSDDVGIAPKAKILPVRVLGNNGAGTPSDIAAGIEYAVNHGAKVITISVGGPEPSQLQPCDPNEEDAIAYAVSHNVVVVSASGDTNKLAGPESPASCPGVLAVGGIEPSGALWSDSTKASYVSVAAPADQIEFLSSNGGYSSNGSGTSFSSPLVAGEAALIRSEYPSMPWYQVDQRIIGTAIRVNGLKTPNDGYGYGIADPAKAVDASKYPVSASSPNPPYATYTAWLKTSDGQAWARQNGVTVPSSGSSRAPGGSGAAPASTAKASSGSSTLIIVLVVVIVIVVAAAIVIGLVTRSRKRSRPGPYQPGPPGTYPSGSQYPPGPPGAYPPGPYPRGSGSYPPPGSASYGPNGRQQKR